MKKIIVLGLILVVALAVVMGGCFAHSDNLAVWWWSDSLDVSQYMNFADGCGVMTLMIRPRTLLRKLKIGILRYTCFKENTSG